MLVPASETTSETIFVCVFGEISAIGDDIGCPAISAGFPAISETTSGGRICFPAISAGDGWKCKQKKIG